MKQRLQDSARKVGDAAKARPAESKWSIIGAVAGAVVGLMIGGVGIAAMGGAAGVPAAAIFAIVGGMVGNRYGVSKDRPVA
ncbi:MULTISPECIES: hypothetical protein [unclassified Rhizobium]|uniref:hypothetical protein n=1 Tax=unclassified Rhizobium TaxID=2613769 RepID=UPI000B2A00DE|nr:MULTISPECIES: hypothetical protein [unclassified Rhizobium]